ncbi:hypothetical protein ACF0H5_000151 [Mactra antiquata]
MTDGDIREDDLKRLLKRYMYKHRFIHPTMPEWMYRNHPREGKAIKPEFVGFGVGLKSQKRKQIKGGYPVLRSVPSRRVTKGEAHRLIDIATKILVATEHVNGVQSRPTSPQRQTAPKPFEKKQRPSTAKYTWDIHGRRHVRVKSYDDSFIPDWLIRLGDEVLIDRKQQHERENSRPKTPEQKPSPRPPSAKYRHREPVPPPPKPTVINVPEPRDDREEVRVSEETQTADNVGIQTETRLLEEYDHTEDLVTDGPWTEYQLYVRTGDRVGAATKDDVRVTLYGEKGRTKEMLLGKSSRNKVKFQRGKEDVFLVPAHHVGKLRKIKIGHDRPELSYAWYLDGVSVYDMTDKRIYEFKCDAWLSGRDGDRQTYKDLPLDCERAFVEAYDDVRGQSYPKAGRDRRNQDNSTESKASKDDKRSLESLRGSNGDKYNSDSDSHTSFSSSSSSSSSDSRRKGRKSPVSPPRAKTPTKTRELSPPRKAEKDDFFDNKSAGPTFTFRSYSEDGQTAQEEYLSGYKAGLEASSAEQKHQHDVEDSERKKVLQGPTIHDAARTGDLERMQALIKYYPDMKQSKDEFGMTPLHVATESGRLDIVKWLTALGVNLNTETQTGYTAIHLAAMNGHLNCMIVLAAMGATLTCRSVDKQTPLHVAAMNGKLECVKWLIANRSSLSAKDQLGRSAVDLANEYQHNEVEDFIRKCIQESRDPNSSLHEMRTSRKGLDPIKEDRGRERNPESAWRDDTNPESVHGNAGSINEGRNSRNNSQMKRKTDTNDDGEKRRLYEQQQKRMEETNSSFLDSIRDEAAL